jgi:MFS family permease
LSGVLVIVVGAPLMLLLRDEPEPYGLLPDGDRVPTEGEPVAAYDSSGDFGVQESLRLTAFWLLTAGTALTYMGNSGIITYHFQHIEHTLTREKAAAAIAVMNIFNIVGRLVGGYLGDKFPKYLLLGTLLSTTGLAAFILASASDEALFLLYGAVFGLSWGSRTPILGSIMADYFGRKAFGRIYGISQLLTTPVALCGPLLIGAIADASGGSYRVGFYLLVAVNLAAGACFFLSRRPTKPLVTS